MLIYLIVEGYIKVDWFRPDEADYLHIIGLVFYITEKSSENLVGIHLGGNGTVDT